MQLYGSLENRLLEQCKDAEKIEVGMGATEFMWSDRHAYEVVRVDDQKHVAIREYDHVPDGEPYSNMWKLISNEDNAVIELVKRGKYWYKKYTMTKEAWEKMLKDKNISLQVFVASIGFDKDKVFEKGSQTKYKKMNIKFGYADYYYDYSF